MPVVLLSQMQVGQSGKVEELTGQDAVCHRLLEMGVTKGVDIQVVRFAPLGDPIDVKIRGYHLSLRRQEAQTIRVVLNQEENKD